MLITSKKKIRGPIFRNIAVYTALVSALPIPMVSTAYSSENDVCKVSQYDFRSLNAELFGKVWSILESKGYQIISSTDPDRYRLDIRWQEYYHNPLHKFAEALAILTTPAGKPYQTHDTTLSFNVFAQHAPSAVPSILSVIEDLPDCNETMPAATSQNREKPELPAARVSDSESTSSNDSSGHIAQ